MLFWGDIYFQEENLTRGRSEPFSKSLPSLPSSDDACDDLDTSNTVTPKAHTSELPPATPLPGSGSELNRGSGSSTPKVKTLSLPPLPHSLSESASNESRSTHNPRDGRSSPPPIPKKDHKDTDSVHRLQSLRHSFQRTEQSLYTLLSRTPITSLNDVRISFLSAAQGAIRRLSAWQKKHLPQVVKGQQAIGDMTIPEPEWWHKSCHAVPGGNIIVREADWGSIIAFTLKSVLHLLGPLRMSHFIAAQQITNASLLVCRLCLWGRLLHHLRHLHPQAPPTNRPSSRAIPRTNFSARLQQNRILIKKVSFGTSLRLIPPLLVARSTPVITRL